MNYTVIGAGMAGLFAAAVLREECVEVLEAQPRLPNNHSALLRFRSPIVGDALNIPFKQVSVMKCIESIGNPIADAVSYSIKANGTAQLRSIISAQGTIEQRYIAPKDFVNRLLGKVNAPIHFGARWEGKAIEGRPTISTIPMPVLMALLGYKTNEEFKSIAGYTCSVNLRKTDLCATIYFPGQEFLAYRASITENRLIIEYSFPNISEEEAKIVINGLSKEINGEVERVLDYFGMDFTFIEDVPIIKQQKYAKIVPIDNDARKRFILWASEHHNIYSFGRFATWRPGLLMDDLVNDLRVIQKIANGATSYDARK